MQDNLSEDLGSIDFGMSGEELAKVEAKGFKELVDGYYDAEIIKAERKKTKAGQPMLAFTLRVVTNEIEGYEFHGQKLFKNIMLPSPDMAQQDKLTRLGYLKGDLKKLKIEDIKKEEDANAWLWRVCNEALGLVVKVKRRTNGQYTNVDFYEFKGSTLVANDDENFYNVLDPAADTPF